MFPSPNVVDEYLDLRFKKDNAKMKHKHYDLIVWWASDPVNNIVQFFDSANKEWEYTGNNNPYWEEDTEYRKELKIVKRWKWAFAVIDAGHEYDYISHKHYTEEEASRALDSKTLIWKEKIDATEKEFTK